MNLYKNPKYYEIAFSFRNIPQEVDFFESAIKKFSKIKVKKVFELASGNSPYLVDPVVQTFKENIVLDIDDHKTKKKIHNSELRKFFFPQEFLSLIKCHNKFEFIGWFNDFNINKSVSLKGRQAVVLRKK